MNPSRVARLSRDGSRRCDRQRLGVHPCLRAARSFCTLSVVTLLLTLAGPSFADEGAVDLYVLELVDFSGVAVPMIVPQSDSSLLGTGPSSRPTRAFASLRARSPKAYGKSTLRIDSASRATVVIDQVADADQVIAEVYWTLSTMGISELFAPPVFKAPVEIGQLSYGAHVPFLAPWDLLRFAKRDLLPRRAFVIVAGKPMPADEAARKLADGDVALRKALTDAIAGQLRGPRLAIIAAVADAEARETFKLKAEDLLPVLGDMALQLRSAALDAIIEAGIAGHKPVIASLEKLVETDSDANLKLRAVKALSKAGVRKYDDLLQAEKLRTGTAAEALKAVDILVNSEQVATAAPALVAALSHADPAVREAAFTGLAKMGRYDTLHEAMDGDQLSEQMRERIATVLVENGSDAARDRSLTYLISKGSTQGAIFAAQTFGKRGSKGATPKLIEALKHENAMVRQAAAEALAVIKDERAIVPLADAAEARDRDHEFMMNAAVEILKTLRLEQVKTLVKSRNLAVRQMAIRSLAGFATGSRPRPDVVALLLEAMKDENLAIKRAAVYALARIEDDGIVRDLEALTADPDIDVRIQVAWALGHASEKYAAAGKKLLEMMRDREKRVRVAAIDGLALRKEAAAVPELLRLVNYPDEVIASAVFNALYALRGVADSPDLLRQIFRRGMAKQNSSVRLACVKALTEGTAVADLDALRQASFDQSKEVKLAAIGALGGSGLPEAMDAISLWFGDPEVEVRTAALEALASIDAKADWKPKKKRYLSDFIAAPGQDDALKKRALDLQKAL